MCKLTATVENTLSSQEAGGRLAPTMLATIGAVLLAAGFVLGVVSDACKLSDEAGCCSAARARAIRR